MGWALTSQNLREIWYLAQTGTRWVRSFTPRSRPSYVQLVLAWRKRDRMRICISWSTSQILKSTKEGLWDLSTTLRSSSQLLSGSHKSSVVLGSRRSKTLTVWLISLLWTSTAFLSFTWVLKSTTEVWEPKIYSTSEGGEIWSILKYKWASILFRCHFLVIVNISN